MTGLTAEQQSIGIDAVLSGSHRVSIDCHGLKAEYAWLPPFEGAAVTKPNRLEVVFSAHSGVLIDLAGRAHAIDVEPGGMYVVGAEPTVLLKVAEYSDTLEMYPDLGLLRTTAEQENIVDFKIEPTLQGQRSVTFRRDAVVLAVAHVLRCACMGRLTLSDIEASDLTYHLVRRLLLLQRGIEPAATKRPATLLNSRTVSRLSDYIEENLTCVITLSELAEVAQLSPFHFARCFKASTGLAPHQYVLARRIELAKRLIITTVLPVQEIAWSVGFENISHFRRQFAAHFGVVPGELRRATLMRRESDCAQG